MKRILILLALISSSLVTAAQQGVGQQTYERDSVQSLERVLSTYLDGREIKSVLTPGEYVEWKLPLKAGQVVLAEARSDSFDPALQIVDEKNNVLVLNDDRYPGDQRPLLLWRCAKDGTYTIRVRSFRDKFGGQFFIRFKTYDSVDASDQAAETDVDAGTPFLIRMPMKAGEIKVVVSEQPPNIHAFQVQQFIAPDGLPDIGLSQPIRPASPDSMLLAPVAGDYYAFATAYGFRGRGRIRVSTRDIVPRKLPLEGEKGSSQAPTNSPALWEVPVKDGEILEVSTPELNLDCHLDLTEAPDLSKYDMSKDETNPFFPRTTPPPSLPPLYVGLPARARDNRLAVFVARRNGTVWVASNGAGPADKTFSIQVHPAAAAFSEDTPSGAKLRIGNTDYWAFNANAGDVLRMNTATSAFTPVIVVRNPDLAELRHDAFGPDQTSDEWRMVVQRPGRYLQAISAMGDGGAGDYTVSRRVIHPKEFGPANPAKADIADGDIQVWKFTVQPGSPVLIHWTSTKWNYDIAVYDDQGNRTDFQHDEIDPNNRFGILNVLRPQTFLIVLTGGRDKASYSIDLGPIPGYKRS